MADAARCNLASGGRFARRRVTSVATVVCGEVRGDEETSAAIKCSAVTTGAAFLRSCSPGVVLTVIEIDVERFVKSHGKVFERRVVAVDACVTDRAHRHLRRGELAAMTISARFVTGKAGGRRVVGPFVASVAGERTMTRTVVHKLRVVGLGALGRCSF